MKLTRLSVQNYRSFSDKTELALSGGMNALVGPNNCGKSNFLGAVGMALDPDYEFDRKHDVPGQHRLAFPRSTLTFQCEGKSPAEKTLLRYAETYERSVASFRGSTYAQNGVLRFVVAYRVNQTGATRQEYFAARGVGDLRGDPELNRKALIQFRKVIQFAAVDSGQNLSSLLSGKFREILHTILREHLRQEFSNAVVAREQYIADLQNQLLAPMREKVLQVAARLFPEIRDVALIPSVPDIDETLSDVEINIRDSVEGALRHKGTGISGGVLVALLRYLADYSRQSLVFAIEEPEAFLHPAAQEDLRDDLERLAERDDVTLLVTTHSPFILSRAAKAQVVLIAKRDDGVSRIEASAAGNEHQAPAITSLYRDSTIPDLLDRYAAIPDAAEAILLVEGSTDRDFLMTAARILESEDCMARIHVLPAGGTDSLMAQAVLLRAEARQPIWVLVDSDVNGRKARDRLVKFGVDRRDILEYGKFLDGLQDAESEWLFPAELVQRFVDQQGEEKVLKSMQRVGGQFRYDFTPVGKELFPRWLRECATSDDMKNWRPVIDTLRRKLSPRIR
jgi:putative ATP-dependent endonuclease of the OLD family